jgi:hypothetical protein
VDVDQQLNQIILKKPDSSEVPKSFTFDFVYGDTSTQQQVYDDCGFPLVESVLEGYNGKSFIPKSYTRHDICLWLDRLRQVSHYDGSCH